jgi:hypothetical protein
MKKKNVMPDSETSVDTQLDRLTLRQRLAERLRKIIANPVIEEKELAAFDIVMSRREVLKLAGSSAIVVGLVSAGVPPTVWARRDPSLAVHPCEVGLTSEEQASVTRAVDISIDTELFQQTIYAKPVVSPEAGPTHAVIEGARHRYRLQCELDSVAPTEGQFLDEGHHWGQPELVQLEETANGWELAHYRHPWSAREDGATTDGMVRDVIMTAADGLVSPKKVLTISSPYNNFVTDDGISGAAYIIVVIDPKATGTGGGWICLGTGKWSMTVAADTPPEYPVEWKSLDLAYAEREVLGAELWWDDKYVDMGHTDPENPATYIPAKSTEHIVLYYSNGPRVITLADNGTPGYMYLWIDMLLYPLGGQPTPTFDTVPRLVHLHSNTNIAASGNNPPYRTDWLAFASSSKNSDGTSTFTTVHVGYYDSTQRDGLTIWSEKGIYGRNQQYNDAYQTTKMVKGKATPPETPNLDYTQMFNVHTFYGTDNGFFVKLAHFKNVGLALFIVYSDSSRSFLAGHFPLALPDVDGIGEIAQLSGGVSKFDGFRFLANDYNGNLFMLRHRRAVSTSTPYSAPIFGFNDADGNPRTFYSTTTNDPYPDGIDSSSTLVTKLDAWMNASTDFNPLEAPEPRNIMLNAALAFATDETALSQATWLGNTYQAAYAPRRFPFDSAFIVIQRAQGGNDTDYSAYTMHNNVVTRTWHTRQIATQVLPEDPGLNEAGDHYHATVTPVNAYGRPVSMLSEENADLVFEVRADAPTTVVDDTHNLYYDIDRYTSFMAAPDSGTGRLSLAVKAENFGLVLYARLVDTSSLTPSLNDTAMLSTTGTTYPWQSADLAAQAQQRMGNDDSDTITLLGDTAPLADTTQYISSITLNTVSTDWDFKSNPHPSQDDIGNLANYLNTSGQTMLGSSFNLSLGASADGISIDPLTAVTRATPGVTGGVRFGYPIGSVTPPISSATVYASDELGSMWSGLSHALHDALHWLQNVDAATYQALDEGAVELVIEVDQITASVSADIMKAVNGVEQELNEAVSSIEEYASVVVNAIAAVVKQTFIYKMIEDIIALISLFVHLQDIQKLAGNLNSYITSILEGPSLIPDDYSSWSEFQSYFGVNNDLSDQMGSLDVDSVTTELTTDVLDAISKNPFNKVTNKILSSLTDAVEDAIPSPPISFIPNEDIYDQIINEINALETDVSNAFENLTVDIIDEFIKQISADMANPQNTFKNLEQGLETLVADLENDAIKPLLNWVDTTARTSQSQMNELISQEQLITINITAIKDLMRLFNIGKSVNNSYSASSADAIFYPMAIMMWISVYTRTGKSVSSFDGINSTSPLSPATGLLGASMSQNDFNLANIAVNFISTEMTAATWAVKAAADYKGETPASLAPLKAASAWINLTRRLCNLGDFMIQNLVDGKLAGSANQIELVYRIGMTGLAVYKLTTLSKASSPDNGTWTPTKIIKAATTLATTGTIVYNVYLTASSDPSDKAIATISGQALARSQGIAKFAWDMIPKQATATMEEAYPYFLVYIAGAPYGFVLQSLAAEGVFGAPDIGPGKGRGLGLGVDGGLGSCTRNNGRGRMTGQR